MRVRHWIGAGLGIALLLVVPGAAAAGGGPRMLAYNASSEFVRRPATVVPYGNGAAISTVIGRLTTTRGKSIRWRTWSSTSARGSGTIWENDMTPSVAEGHWYGHPVTLRASRVVHGRYTRLALSDLVNGSTRTVHLCLSKSVGGYAWRTFVRVPSWRDFPSSYTGTDWATTLESIKAAIEAGFDDAHLFADVQFVNAYAGDKAYQRPTAGSRVEEWTTVHIHVPVID